MGPEAPTEWYTRASFADWMSNTLSENNDVLDWAYVDLDEPSPTDDLFDLQAGLNRHIEEIEIGDPDTYEEGSFV